MNYCRNCMVSEAVVNLGGTPMCERCVNDLFDELQDEVELASWGEMFCPEDVIEGAQGSKERYE